MNPKIRPSDAPPERQNAKRLLWIELWVTLGLGSLPRVWPILVLLVAIGGGIIGAQLVWLRRAVARGRSAPAGIDRRAVFYLCGGAGAMILFLVGVLSQLQEDGAGKIGAMSAVALLACVVGCVWTDACVLQAKRFDRKRLR